MLLAIDIGNSLIKFGVFDGDKLLDRSSIPPHRDKLDLTRFESLQIDTVMVASVVPGLTDRISNASESAFNLTPTIIDHSADFGFKINYYPPESVGIDRLINAFAAVKKYGTPVIVCSFGTATVIDAVSKENEFLGGLIAPGVRTMAESLQKTTSKLPAVEITEPQRLLGNSTESAIVSGIVNGQIAMAEGLIEKIISEFPVSSLDSDPNPELETRNSRPKVVATGGFANLIASNIKTVTQIDENLTLEGLLRLSDQLKANNQD